MGNCLKTQLKEVVSNSELVKMGEIRLRAIAVPSSLMDYNNVNSLRIQAINGPVTVRVDGNGYFSNNAATIDTDRMTQLTVQPSDGLVYLALKNNNYNVFIEGIYNLLSFGPKYAYTQPLVHFGMSDIKYFTSITSLYCSAQEGSSFDGFEEQKNFENLQYIYLNDTSFKGNTSIFRNSNYIRIINLGNTNVTGNIADFGNDVSELIGGHGLNEIQIANTVIEGSLEELGAAQVAAGRHDYTITVRGNGIVTAGGTPFTGSRFIFFGTSMINPTTEETNQGYQIRNTES